MIGPRLTRPRLGFALPRHRKTVCDDARAVLSAAEQAKAGTTWGLDGERLVVVQGETTVTYTGLRNWHRERELLRVDFDAVRGLVIEPDERAYHDARETAQLAQWREDVFGSAKFLLNSAERGLKQETETLLAEFVAAL